MNAETKFFVQQKGDRYGWTSLLTSESDTLEEAESTYEFIKSFWAGAGDDAPELRIIKIEVVK